MDQTLGGDCSGRSSPTHASSPAHAAPGGGAVAPGLGGAKAAGSVGARTQPEAPGYLVGAGHPPARLAELRMSSQKDGFEHTEQKT